jgi:aconitate hydratase
MEEARHVVLEEGSNIVALPELDPFPDKLELPILLKVKDNISTDEIMPAGARVLPYRSNIPKISEFAFEIIDRTYAKRALAQKEKGSHAIIGGQNYGQGSSREHAALAPRYLGLQMVIAKSFARIHRNNLINFGILPVTFDDPTIYENLDQEDVITVENVRKQLQEANGKLNVRIPQKNLTFIANHTLTPRLIEILFSGGLTNWVRNQRQSTLA